MKSGMNHINSFFRYLGAVLLLLFYPVQALRWTNRCDSCNRSDVFVFCVTALSGAVIFTISAISWYAAYANRNDVALFASCLAVALTSTALYGFIGRWNLNNIAAMHEKGIYLREEKHTCVAIH